MLKHFLIFSLQIILEDVVLSSGFSTKARDDNPVKKALAPKGKDKNAPSSSQQGGKTAETPRSQLMMEGLGSSHDPLSTPSGQVQNVLQFLILVSSLSSARQCSQWE